MANNKTVRRWTIKSLPFGYVENRHGIACMRYKGQRKSARLTPKCPPLRFIPENKEMCMELLKQWILRIDHPELFEPTAEEKATELANERTIHKLIAEFKDVKYPDLTEIVQKRFEVAVNKFFPSDLLLDYETVYAHLKSQKQKIKAAVETRRKDLQYIKRLLQFAVDRDYLSKNPMNIIGIPKAKGHDGDAPIYTQEEVARIITYFRDRAREPWHLREEQNNFHQYSLFFQFLSLTALRSKEALLLQWTDVSREGFWIFGKGSRRRFFPLVNPDTNERLFPEVDDVLEELKQFALFNEGKLFCWKHTQSPNKALTEAKRAMRWKQDKRTVRTFRATAEWYWDNVLGLDFLLGCQLAGHSPAVRVKNYLKRRQPKELGRAMARNLKHRDILSAQLTPQRHPNRPATAQL